jgi:2-keto-3-deoxy-6-phosphogluconate aldolase
VQKIFPGVANGHNWIKAVSAALPMLTLNPTSGVDLDNAAGVLAVAEPTYRPRSSSDS